MDPILWWNVTGDGQHWCRYQLIDQAKIATLPGRQLAAGDLAYPCWYRYQLRSANHHNNQPKINK